MSLVISYQIHLIYYLRYDSSKKVIMKLTLVIIKIDLMQNYKIFSKKLLLYAIAYYEITNEFSYFISNTSNILY